MKLYNLESLKKIASFIKERFGAQKVILFGSYAYGNPNSDSDIDLLVIMDTKEKFSKQAVKIRVAIDEMLPEKSIDIIVRSPEYLNKRVDNNDFFMKEILTKGIYL